MKGSRHCDVTIVYEIHDRQTVSMLRVEGGIGIGIISRKDAAKA
jgi:hypothetical protein